ncbi:MAG: hypothetical protein JW966_08305 [Anaerolineae bacterium]|nr:hypothetical protein [Anaerolineae bacterium]
MQGILNRRNVILGVLLAVVVGLLVIVLDGDDPGAQTTALGYMPLVTATPTAIPVADASLPGGSSSVSALVTVQGLVERRLVLWPLTGDQTPQEIERYVGFWPLMPDPTGRRVLYRTDSALMILDVLARRAHIVGTLPEEGEVMAVQWSPDSSAVTYVVETGERAIAYYARTDGVDGAKPLIEAPSGLLLDVAWLDDGRPVVEYLGVGPVGGLEANHLVINPADGEEKLLSSDTRVIQPHSPTYSPNGIYYLYQSSSWEQAKFGQVCTTGPLEIKAASWYPEYDQPRQVAFELKNVYFDGANWLQDGRVLMRGITNDVCSPGASGLYIANLGELPRQIVQAHMSYTWKDNDELWGVPYALSPDESLVAWVDNDTETHVSSIYLTALELSGDTTHNLLFQTEPPRDSKPFVYEDGYMILEFVWLP